MDGEAQPQPNTRLAYNSPIERYGSQIAILTDPTDSLYDFELFLRRLKKNEDGTLSMVGGRRLWKPMMNDVGINTVLLCMQGVVNQMTALSNLDEQEIYTILRDFTYNMVESLAFNRSKYNLEVTDRPVVVGSARRFLYIFMKRPFQEGDKKFFKGITQEIKQTTEISKPKSGFSLNPFSKK